MKLYFHICIMLLLIIWKRQIERFKMKEIMILFKNGKLELKHSVKKKIENIKQALKMAVCNINNRQNQKLSYLYLNPNDSKLTQC
jgi:hypothetical protein